VLHAALELRVAQRARRPAVNTSIIETPGMQVAPAPNCCIIMIDSMDIALRRFSTSRAGSAET